MTNPNYEIAYIILAYKSPNQLARLVQRLSTPNTSFFIHIDKKVPIKPFLEAIDTLHQDNIYYVKRVIANWGEFGPVQATINALDQILSGHKRFDRIINLSGFDYPIKNNRDIFDFFANNHDKSFMSYSTMPVTAWNWVNTKGGILNLETYYIRGFKYGYFYPPLEPISGRIKTIIYMLFKLILPLPRKYPKNIKPYAGLAYFAINWSAALAIINFIHAHPKLVHFYRYTWSPDEFLFQTALFNSGNSEILANVINNDLRFIDWNSGSAHPCTLTMNHSPSILTSDHLFARKFDMENSPGIMDEIDRQILL